MQTDEQKFDPALIDKADVVAINWSCAKHAVTGKARSYARKRGKKVIYAGVGNEKQLLDLLYKECVAPGKQGRETNGANGGE
ncbi:MAG: hypothetical protein LBP78_08335 [Acidaminococcales bacterium]|nr:hypothetical protein [Acidaminococcales bacterium]